MLRIKRFQYLRKEQKCFEKRILESVLSLRSKKTKVIKVETNRLIITAALYLTLHLKRPN